MQVSKEITMILRAMISSLTAASLLALAPLAVRAEDAQQIPPMQGKEWCQQNPDKCKEMRDQREAFCKSNPEQCEKMKQKRAERKEWCDKNPEECAKQREQRTQKMEEMREKCKADPAKCDEKKEEMRERWNKHEHKPGPAPEPNRPGNPKNPKDSTQ